MEEQVARDDLSRERRHPLSLRAGEGLRRSRRLRPRLALSTRRATSASARTVFHDPVGDGNAPRADRGGLHARALREVRRPGPRIGGADLHRRAAALRLDADRADPREPQPGRGHGRAADTGAPCLFHRPLSCGQEAVPGIASATCGAGTSRPMGGSTSRKRRPSARPSGRSSPTRLPNNFSHVGLIHLILPNAKIINARRHPFDSCLGGYKQLFAKGQHFTYDMTDLAAYYRQYDETMKHWHRVLPGKVLDVHYEETVSDLETQVRRILAHCGLPFEESCVRFHANPRAVRTASSEQVRQPIYTDALGYLAPLREAPRTSGRTSSATSSSSCPTRSATRVSEGAGLLRRTATRRGRGWRFGCPSSG